MRKRVQEAAAKKDVKQLYEHFREELTGSKDILLADAYEKSLEKPKTRMPSEKQVRSKRAYWLDFTAFLNERYPDLQKLSEVRPLHAEAYIQYLRKNGRFNKTVSYKGTVITQERSYQLQT